MSELLVSLIINDCAHFLQNKEITSQTFDVISEAYLPGFINSTRFLGGKLFNLGELLKI